MTEEMMKDVAKALIEKADKNVLMNIIKDILKYEDNYNCPITQYVIAKCIGKPQINIVNVDLEKIKKYAENHYTNKYHTLVEGSVKLVGVNPVRRSVRIKYEYTENDDNEKKVHKSSSDIDTEYNDVLKDEEYEKDYITSNHRGS